MARWTAQEDEILKEALARGFSHAMVAMRLPKRTRNSCVSRAQKLKKAGWVQDERKKLLKKRRAQKPQKNRKSAKSAKSKSCSAGLPAVVSADGVICLQPVALVDHQDHQCRWPVGDVGEAGFAFCGNPRAAGHGSYCAGHVEINTRKSRRGSREFLTKPSYRGAAPQAGRLLEKVV